MKKLLIGASTVVALGIGGVLVAGQFDEAETKDSSVNSVEIQNEAKEETSEVQSKSNETSSDVTNENVTNEGSTETQPAPTPAKRFEELPEGMRPWGKWDFYQVEQFQAEGKTVYLFEDAEELEKSIHNALNARKIPENKKNMKILDIELERMTNHLNAFVKDVKSQTDNQAYISKLEETEVAVNAVEYDLALNLINEATQLRESK